MTLKEYTKSLPKERVQLAATDLDEAAKIEQEHAAVPGAVFDTPEQAEGNADAQQPAAPAQSFDLTNDDDVKGFIKGMELSHPELVNRLRRDERAWDDMLALDSNYTSRIQRDGQIKFTGDDKADYDFFRWAYGRGMLQSDTSIGGLASAFGRGLWQMAKGAAKLGATAAKSAANPAAAMELGATTVDAAQAAVAEYQQLGAGLAALTSGDNPQVKVAAMYELAKFADTEQKNHNAWRKAINDSFAEVPVDEDSVEFLSEAFDISNLIGAGAGKVVTTGLKRAGAAGAAELLGKSRKALGSEMLAAGVSKVPVIGTPYKRAILVGQADLLSEEAQIAYKAVAEAQADLAAKRATLAAAPAADPKDVLLKQVAEADANVARQQAAFDVANTKLTTVRQGVTEALDLEGRGLMDRAASGAVEGAGVAVRGTGRAMTRAYRGLSELLTGEADNAAFDMAAGQVAGNLANKGNIVTRIGQDMVAAGRTMAQNGATIPYFRRLRQAEDATKLTRGAAAFIDWSHLGWAADKVGDTLKAGAAGVPVSGAFGYVASGGDLAAAAESAGAGAAYGIGGGAYGQWEAYKDPRFRYEELLANRRQFRDTLSARDVGGASQLQIFDQLDAGDQLAVSTYAQGKPDVAFRFINDRNQASGYYDRDNNVVVINKASKTPVADIFRHEVAHFVERHGLQAQVREMYLGDAEKGVIGQYTALDPLGNPVFVESTDPDGATRYGYKLNEAGEKLKADYESKIRVVDPTFKMSDDYLASELFAEQYADRMLGGGFRRDLSRNAVDNIVDALAAKPVLKNFLGGIGLLFDQNDNVVGTGVFKELKANEGVRRLISGFTSEVSKGKKAAIEDSAEQHVFTETELRNPELATKWLQGGGAMRFGPDGKPVYDSKGVPQFLTEKEADAQQRDLANELITEIEKHVAGNPEDADLMQRREIVDVNGVKRTLFSGRRIPAAVIDALEKQNRFNPHQLAHLRAASASVEKNGTGAMIAHFYQAASRKLGGKAYKTVGGRWRRDGVVGFQITKDGNVVINSVSWEQLAENATKAAKTKLAREVYATAGMPVDTAIMADVKTYLGNLVDGKPGATDIGEARRDFINNLLGIRMAANADANPLFETTTAPKTILTNLRLDRINRMAPLDYVDVAWGPQQYRQAKANMRPETAVQRDVGANVDFSTPPSDEDATAALSTDKQSKFGLARDLKPGTPVGLRIDIPAFQRTGKYVVSVHEKAKGNTVGKIVGYDTVVTVDNPTFMSNEAGASKILTGDKNKFPIATVEGSFNSSREIPADINEWTPVGFDPLDHSYFYDKKTDEPVVGGSQAISVGNTVFVKDPVYGDRSQFQYRPDSRQTETPEFKRWFGDSTAVDERGNPAVWYHGTTAQEDFNVFKPNPALGGAIFVSPSAEYANMFTAARGGRVYPVYAKVEKTAPGIIRWGQNEGEKLAEAKRKGYDSARVTDGYGVVNIAVFNPTQIKSATGNTGAFDPTNPDIRYRPDAPSYDVGSEEHLRDIDSLGQKDAPQTAASVRSLKYPLNPHKDSVTLPPRWGLVNRNIVGMPRSHRDVIGIVDRVEKRLRNVMVDHPEFAKESARFYRDMAESSEKLTSVVFPEAEGDAKYNHSDLMLRFLALGSPRTDVSGNATKASGSAAAAGGNFTPGYKLGFTQQQRGAMETYAAWRNAGHFDLENTSGVDDKVRSFYLNGLSELIEMAQERGDAAAVELLTLRAGRSLNLVPDGTNKLTPELKAEIDRHLDGKATVDMWDMAGKGFAWPGFILRKSARNSAKQPFQWSQDKFSVTSSLADNAWKTVLRDLEIASPADLRYQQARALRVDGNMDWTEKTWAERIKQPFAPETEFTYFTQGTEAGLSPGGGGPLYDAQQAIDGLVADRLNKDGLADAFGKTKLKARNAQEILWALEKLDNPIESNNDLSLFGNTFDSLVTEAAGLRLGKDVTKKSRAEAVLGAMERAYAAMAEQQMPFEVVTGGTSDNARLIQGKQANLAAAGDPSPIVTLTDAVADGLGDAINDFATAHGIDVTAYRVQRGRGGYTEGQALSISPNVLVVLRGAPDQTRMVLDVISRALDQDGGNILRMPTVREMNDVRVKKNNVVTFDTRGLSETQREAFFMDLSTLKDDKGNRFLTGFTETTDGIAIGDQFYDGDMAAELVKQDATIRDLLQKHSVPEYRTDRMIIDTFFRGTPETGISDTPFAKALTQHLHDKVRSAKYSGRAFPQRTDVAGVLTQRGTAAGAEPAPGMSATARKELLVKLNSAVDAAWLRGDIDDAAVQSVKALIPKQ